jgi:hypothetical protein
MLARTLSIVIDLIIFPESPASKAPLRGSREIDECRLS